jgi:hypothetical protein
MEEGDLGLASAPPALLQDGPPSRKDAPREAAEKGEDDEAQDDVPAPPSRTSRRTRDPVAALGSPTTGGSGGSLAFPSGCPAV